MDGRTNGHKNRKTAITMKKEARADATTGYGNEAKGAEILFQNKTPKKG